RLVLPGPRARLDDAVGDHLHRLLERELLPIGAVRPPVLDLVLAERVVRVRLRRGALRAQPAARDRARRVALDLDDLAVLDVDELSAADGAVRADRVDDALGLVDARRQRPRPRRLDGAPEPERVSLGQLTH